jgi:hypothetical protein
MKNLIRFSVPLLLAIGAYAQTTTQSFNLQAGWNSIWLEVTPTNTEINSVFAGLPVEAVWTFSQRLTAVDFIQDVNEPVWNRDQWLVHLPTNRFESINNDLFHVFGLRAYLVKMTAPATLAVTGRPVIRVIPWSPDAYNLRGFPIDPAGPPTFFSFFRHSPAHYSTASNQLEQIYKLNAAGNWLLVGPGEAMQRGAAYWTYCRGGSDYQAPLQVQVEAPDGIDFAGSVEESTLGLINRTGSNVTATVRDQTSPTPIAYARFNPITGTEWFALPSPFNSPVPSGQLAPVRLAIRRGSMANANYGSLLEIRNGAGTRWLVPLTATRQATAAGGAPNYAGLWAGSITVNRVNEVNNPTNSTTPTQVGSDFNLRLLLHVDNSGATRLLREVIQLWQNGTTTNNANGQAVVAAPGHYVLVTDDRLIPSLTGGSLRDGELTGRRLSSAFFDFPTTPDANFLPLGGSFGRTGLLTGSFSLAPTFARNPFLHRYHPDHDNLNATFNGFREEAYNITRAFELRFSSTNLAGVTTPDYGYKILSGTYRETVTGLNKSNVFAGGVFRLNRVSEIATLNQ